MIYDPRDDGARCDECVLRKARAGVPVPAEIRPGSVAVVVTESPREKDVEEQRPLVDSAGIEFNESLKAVGIPRGAVSITTALACRPPENELDRVLVKLSRDNKKRIAAKEDPLPHPIDCCRPRLMHDIGQTKNIITLGKIAFQAVTGQAASVTEIRGGPVEGRFDVIGNFITGGDKPKDVKVLPTLHPAFVLRARRWTRAFRSDLSRAFRWFRGGLGWQHPYIDLTPSPDEVEAFLARTDIPYIYDVETTFDDPLIAELKCVGIANENASIVVSLKSIEGPNGSLVDPPWYTASDLLRLRGILRDFFIDDTKLKVGHNAGYFDRIVIEQHFGVTPKPLLDTILLHRSVESELPHKLGYIGSVYTDVTSWKAAHTAEVAQTDEELTTYCAVDCVVTARVMPKLADAVKLRRQENVVGFDHRVQAICADLHRTGMWVDRPLRNKVSDELRVKIADYLAETRVNAENPNLNPNSTYQIRDLLFDKWGLTPAEMTKLGDPSTSDESLRLLRTQNRDRENIVKFIDSLRRYRKVAKEYGTYVTRLVPYGQPVDGVQFRSEDEQDEAARGLILPDGRIHPDYNAHGTTSGRLSSSNPNAQNFPKHLRALVKAEPGRVLVGADADQLELRIIASVAQIPRYLETFSAGGDPHAQTASMMFGKQFDGLVPKSDQWDKLRKIAKSIAYASFYGSGDETVHGLVTSAENADGTLMYPDLTLNQVATLRKRWLREIPQLQKWWDECLDTYRTVGYIVDPVLGRRRDFLDGEKFNEIINFGVQSAGAHIIHMATFDLVEGPLKCELWGPGTGLVNQCHDALTFEVPCPHDEYRPLDADGKVIEKEREFGFCPPGCECDANTVARMIKEAMNRTVPGLPDVSFAAKPKIGLRWSEV
jgi:DNA polymerase-1